MRLSCIILLLMTGLGSIAPASATVPPAVADSPSGECHEEGKDPVCGHYLMTMSRLKAAEQALAAADASPPVTDVTHCFLDMELDFAARSVSGTNTLSVTSLVDGLSSLSLDLWANMVVDSTTMPSGPVTFSRAGNKIAINLDRAYNAGESFDVTVVYHGQPQNAGFSSFSWTTHSGAVLASSLSEPWYAGTWWPCKDELIDKFTLDFWITVPAGNIAAANGRLEGTDTLTGNRVRYRWHESYPIVTYLVSLAATNYARWTQYYNYAGGSMPVEFYSYPESQASMQAGTSNVLPAIQTFSRPDVYGEYPFINEKYGLAQFAWGGGMENQTITSQGVFADWINAHELSHQWWGDMVTCATWHDVWLNEGFATYSEAVYEEKKPGGGFVGYSNRMQARRPGNYGGSVYVYDATSESTLFSTDNVYNKGAWALHMLRHVIGDQNFFDTLAAYRTAHAGGSATTNDFKAVAESVYGGDLTWFFNEWVYGIGAPSYRYGYVDVLNGGRHEVRLDIEQYQTAYSNFRMPIDITVTTPSGPRTQVVWQQGDVEWYVLPVDGPVSSVQFDKDTWILRAGGTSTAYVPPLQITASTPAPAAGGASVVHVSVINVTFNGPVTCTHDDFAVTGSISGPRTFTLSVPTANVARLSFASVLPAGETWTVGISDNVRSAANGSQLDGEIANPTSPAALPSGDGLPGGSGVLSFTTGFPGDFDRDGDVDQEDFGHLQACLLDAGVVQEDPQCLDADLNHETHVDGQDVAIFTPCLSGAGVLPDPNCDQ